MATNLNISSDPKVEMVFNNYPDAVRIKMLALRKIVINSARQIDQIDELEETLKWGEPSYLTKYGSTIRMDWKVKNPGQYAMYFKCTSKLVPTFQRLFSDTLKFEGDRAIVFKMNENIPEAAIKKCIRAALTYHKIKHLPNLGIEHEKSGR